LLVPRPAATALRVQGIVDNMKTALLLFAIVSLFCNGCSFFIAQSGKDTTQLTTREQVRQEFGKPELSSTENDKDFDDFRFHGKVANEAKADNYRMAFAVTFGLGELLTFPVELFETGRDLMAGQDIRFYYDQNGRTSECLVNGEHPYLEDPFNRKSRE
jgi:hypothetical protein